MVPVHSLSSGGRQSRRCLGMFEKHNDLKPLTNASAQYTSFSVSAPKTVVLHERNRTSQNFAKLDSGTDVAVVSIIICACENPHLAERRAWSSGDLHSFPLWASWQ